METLDVTLSTKELAARQNVDYATAGALIKLLVSKGIARPAGERPNPLGKGKPTNLFNMPARCTVTFDFTPVMS